MCVCVRTTNAKLINCFASNEIKERKKERRKQRKIQSTGQKVGEKIKDFDESARFVSVVNKVVKSPFIHQ